MLNTDNQTEHSQTELFKSVNSFDELLAGLHALEIPLCSEMMMRLQQEYEIFKSES